MNSLYVHILQPVISFSYKMGKYFLENGSQFHSNMSLWLLLIGRFMVPFTSWKVATIKTFTRQSLCYGKNVEWHYSWNNIKGWQTKAFRHECVWIIGDKREVGSHCALNKTGLFDFDNNLLKALLSLAQNSKFVL